MPDTMLSNTAETTEPAITLDEFIDEFAQFIISKIGKTFADGSSVIEYAQEIAPTYYNDPINMPLDAADCAKTDMSYWEA